MNNLKLQLTQIALNLEPLVLKRSYLNPSRPNPGRREKIKVSFYFHVHFGASKGFMKTLKAFIKPFEAPQRSVDIKIQLNFYFNTTFRNARVVKG